MLEEEIRQRINHSLHKSCLINEDGDFIPPVCILCDRFIKPKSIRTISIDMLFKHSEKLKPNYFTNIPSDLAECYKVNESVCNRDLALLRNCLLSPRATYLADVGPHRTPGFTACTTCEAALRTGKMPRFCIANNFCFGDTPDCLLQLTDIELAMITNVKTFGYCFSYTGGLHKELKGSLSYYKVSKESIIRSGARFEGLNLNQNVVVLLYGKMTPTQYEKAKKKNHIRTEYITAAIRWLLLHNNQWMHLQEYYHQIVNSIQDPYLVDNTIPVVDNSHTNVDTAVEDTETFQVFYPDGQISTLSGGQNNIDDFRDIVREASLHGYNIEYRCTQIKEAVAEYKDDNLINACLLQFPYGRGNMNEHRVNSNGTVVRHIDINEYIIYLSMLSLPQFHRDLFTLILYNMYMKQMMVRKAAWKVRNKADASLFANEVKIDDINEAIHAKRCRSQSRNESILRGQHFLGAIDVISQAVPHSNEAARKFRRDVECLQHHFGCPTFFLTVTPDDDNHFLIQVYTFTLIDSTENIADLTNEQLLERSKKRTELRLKFPGITAYFFELALDIIIEDVIGWDMLKEKPLVGVTGIFGNPTAFSETTEEQGRKTLHAHFLIWVEQLNIVRELLHNPSEHIRKHATKRITQQLDSIASSKCFFNDRVRCRSISHDCQVNNVASRQTLKVINDQQLRNLRCKRKADDEFVYCIHCDTKWNDQQLLNSYLKDNVKLRNFEGTRDADIRRLKSMAIQYQKTLNDDATIDNYIIDAAYNHHIHTLSCFKKSKTDGTINKYNETDECRYRYPQREQPQTIVQNASETPIPWYLWDGKCEQRDIKEICIKRHPYDAFQNVYCRCISYSKLTCNCNISFVMPGPIAQYCVTYTTKGTQKDDTEEYENVKRSWERTISKLRKHAADASESIRRLLATSFAHQNSNVIGPSLASFCTRHGSRFQLSHTTVWCPIRDIKCLLNGAKVATMIKFNTHSTYFECNALHYLCRPEVCEAMSAFDFYSKYDIVKATSNNNSTCPRFINTDNFHHPSYLSSEDYFRQCIQLRENTKLVKILQYDFPDSSKFSSILTETNGEINETMEQYSEQVLLLFHSYRNKEELQLESSYTKKLRQLISDNKLHKNAPKFLQYIQDSKSNNLRSTLVNDDLQRHTSSPYTGEEPLHDSTEEEEEVLPDVNTLDIDQLLETLELELQEDESENADDNEFILSTYSCDAIRTKGRHDCGFQGLTEINTSNTYTQPFIEFNTEPQMTSNDDISCPMQNSPNYHPNRKEITHILIKHKSTTNQTLLHFDNTSAVQKSVLEPNGSARSIINWSRKSKLDGYQRSAFEIITSSFVLSFFKNARNDDTISHRNKYIYLEHKKRLQLIANRQRRTSNQLIMFLHGPAGSGKTTAINLAVKYCRQYCMLLTQDETIATRSVLVTAMTGVAATLLNGETVHSAVYLQQRKNITEEQVELWMKTRMLIVDEISFACKKDLETLHKKLIQLKQNNQKYGGIHVIFTGDLRQLEPVAKGGKKPLYAEDVPYFKDWLNCYVELGGIHRYKHDPEWGALLQRMRDGNATTEDIDKINSRVVSSNMKLPEDIRYATFYNLDRDSINCALFEERAKQYSATHGHTNGFIMIFSDDLKFAENPDKARHHVYKEFKHKRIFWQNCGEDDVEFDRGRMDPVLKLYYGCRVMLPTNIKVSEGQANGTQAFVEKIILKPNAHTYQTKLNDHVTVTSVFASQIDYIQVKHENQHIHPALFDVQPRKHTFKAYLPKPRDLQLTAKDKKLTGKNNKQKICMQATQLPILVNNATTGHKLQGSGVPKLFVHNWSYRQNWVYVMLSRVKTIEGLYARRPLLYDLSKYQLPPSYISMITDFRNNLTPTEISTEQYNHLRQPI